MPKAFFYKDKIEFKCVECGKPIKGKTNRLTCSKKCKEQYAKKIRKKKPPSKEHDQKNYWDFLHDGGKI